MKKMKKLLSMLLAVIMVLAMAAPSFADTTTTGGTGTISIDNAAEGKVYDVYKIFTAAYNDGNANSFTYTITEDDEWYSVVDDYDGIELINSGSKTAEGKTVFYVEKTDKFNAPNFAALLKANIGTKASIITLTKNDPSATVDLGYYFVATDSGALCNLTTTAPNAQIHDKNEKPTIDKKIVGGEENGTKASAQVGEVVSYEITGKVPVMTGYSEYTYKVKDIMSAGLTFNGESAAVKINNVSAEFVSPPVATPELDEDDNPTGKMVITFDVNIDKKDTNGEFIYAFNEPISITYNATVNENAIASVNPVTNKAELEYSNNPQDPETTNKTPGTTDVEVYTSTIVIDKYKLGEETTKLSEAEFKLSRTNSENNVEYYKWDETNKKVTWTTEADAEVFVTNENGAVRINGLKKGAYSLHEVKAPTGYNRLEGAIEVVVTDDKIKVDDAEFYGVKALVANNVGSMLPSTGGIGTTIFYAAGIILMASAVFFVVRRKKA